MTRTILGGLAISALLIAAPLSAASAADMPVKAPPVAPAPVFSWTGLYIGAYAGGAWSGPATTSDPCLVGVSCPTFGTYNGVTPVTYNFTTSFTGGGEIGYNWQPTIYTLLGVENKYGYMHLHSSAVMNPFASGDTTANTTIGNWYDTYTARVGAVSGHLLMFLEAGGVTARVSTGVVDVTPPVTINTTTAKTITSWAAGGGLEYAINPNWSIKGEVMTFGLHSTINECAQVGGFPPGTIDCNYTKIGAVTMVDLGLNYRFNWK
jgi:outer membrane immunogenic protein